MIVLDAVGWNDNGHQQSDFSFVVWHEEFIVYDLFKPVRRSGHYVHNRSQASNHAILHTKGT